MIVSPTNGVSCTLTASGTTYNTAWSWYSQSNNIKEFRLSSGVELGPNLNYMFHDASNLATLDVSNWNTSNVTNMNYMFEGASSLTTLDVSNWNISNVTDMWGMFYHASSLTSLDVSKWDTSKVARMGSMFYYASKLTTLDISDWNTSNVADMSGMFFGASSLTTLDLTGWDTSSVANMSYMFGETPNLSKISYGPNFAWKNNHGSLGEAPSGRYTSKWAILQDGNITDGTPEGTYATGTQYAVSELPSNPSETITIVWHQNTPKYTITYSAGDKGTFGDISYTQNLNEATKQPDTDSLTSINCKAPHIIIT